MSQTRHRIAIAGASGRMGRMLIEAIGQSSDCVLGGALDLAGGAAIGSDASAFMGSAGGVSSVGDVGNGGSAGVPIQSDIRQGVLGCSVLIDFTRPEGTMAHVAVCRDLGIKLVIGTTGFSDAQKAEIVLAAKDIAIVMAPNMSVGVNVTLKLLEMAAKALATGYDIEIVEAHHRHKVDAPSGTALRMGEVVATALGRDLRQCAVYAREGVTGERDPSSIGFSSVRGGDIVGDHSVLFLGEGERIEITHKSSSRTTYAQGALRAARFLQTQSSGLFDMFDVLALNQAK